MEGEKGGIIGVFFVIVHLKVSPKDKGNIQKMMNAMIGATRAHVNCLHSDFFTSTMNDGEMTLMQTWKSEADLENHIRSQEFRNVLIAMEHSIAPPEVRICRAETMGGVEYIKRLRLMGKNERGKVLVQESENR